MEDGSDNGNGRSTDPSTRVQPFDPPVKYRDPLARSAERIGWFRLLILAVLVYGAGEKIVLPMLGGYFTLHGDPSTWRPDVEALVSGFVFVPTILAAYVWQIGGVSKVFTGFARAESFGDQPGFDEFVNDARTWFARNRWWPVSAAVAVVGTLVEALWLWDPRDPKPVVPWWDAGRPLSYIVAVALAPALWYAMAQIVTGEVRLAWTLQRMWKRLGASFVLRWRKHDTGVVSLSRHVAFMATIGAVVLLSLVLGALLPQIRDTRANPDFTGWFAVIWAAYLVIVPGITLAIIWPAHRVMSRAKDERIHAVIAEINNELALVESKMSDRTTLEAGIARIEELRKLKVLMQSELPRWPLPNVVQSVSWSVVIPILLSIGTTILNQIS